MIESDEESEDSAVNNTNTNRRRSPILTRNRKAMIEKANAIADESCDEFSEPREKKRKITRTQSRAMKVKEEGQGKHRKKNSSV